MRDRSADAARYLEEWHANHTGATSQVLGGLLGADGQSSYTRVAQFAAPGDRVLDLACGDGFLLQKVLDRGATAVGCDRSTAELGMARHQVDQAPVVRGDAARLPLRDSAFDKVLCHFALMLLQPLELVAGEVARVLRLGGMLVAALPGPSPQGEMNAWTALRSAVALAIRGSSFDPPPLQDERALEPEALGSILRGAGFDAIEHQPVEFRRMVPVGEARLSLTLTYLPDLLAIADRARFDTYLTEGLFGMADDDGNVPMIDIVNIVGAVRSV
jgi:SAM-dependent methyltransferase